jgi:hypothetical protein
MDPLETYREDVMNVLRPWEQRPGPQSTLRFEAVFDRERDRYLMVVVGWDGKHHVHSTLIHVDIIDGKGRRPRSFCFTSNKAAPAEDQARHGNASG